MTSAGNWKQLQPVDKIKKCRRDGKDKRLQRSATVSLENSSGPSAHTEAHLLCKRNSSSWIKLRRFDSKSHSLWLAPRKTSSCITLPPLTDWLTDWLGPTETNSKQFGLEVRVTADDSMMGGGGGGGRCSKGWTGGWTQTKKTKQAWRSHSAQWRGGGGGWERGRVVLTRSAQPTTPRVPPPSDPPIPHPPSVLSPLRHPPSPPAACFVCSRLTMTGIMPTLVKSGRGTFCPVSTMKWDCNGDKQWEEGKQLSARARMLQAICRDHKRVAPGSAAFHQDRAALESCRGFYQFQGGLSRKVHKVTSYANLFCNNVSPVCN